MTYSVTKNGKPLDPSLYNWDEKTKTFTTAESGLVLDFCGYSGVTFKTGNNCTFDTGYGCTFDTGSDCTFNTHSGCTFKTGNNCTFDTGYGCTFDTGSYCTFNTSSDCTFNTGSQCIIVRRDEFEVIQPAEGEVIQLCPYNIPGYISKLPGEEAFYKEIDGQRAEHIIADGILSRVVKKRGNVYHVVNHSEDKVTYLVKDGDLYAHGETLEEARDDLKFKINGYDTSKYNDFTLDTELTLEEAIEMYRKITRACAKGTKHFVNHVLSPERKASKKKYTVKEVIELTKHQWNHDRLVEFFKGENND